MAQLATSEDMASNLDKSHDLGVPRTAYSRGETNHVVRTQISTSLLMRERDRRTRLEKKGRQASPKGGGLLK